MLKLNPDIELVKLTPEHAPKMLSWVQTDIVRDNIGLQSEPSLEKTIKFIEFSETSDDIYPFAILLNGEHIGNTILDKVDRYLSMARFSIYIGQDDLRGKGFGSTATYLICKYGFEQLGLHKIWLIVHNQNYQGTKAYQKVGFRLEGVLREEFLLNNKRVDMFYMGLLNRELNNDRFI